MEATVWFGKSNNFKIIPFDPILIVPSDHSYPQIDSEGFGEIPSCDFIAALRTLKFQSQVPMNKRELLLERALNGNGIVSFQDFVNVVSPPSFTKPTSCTLHINWLFIRFANNYRDPLQPHNRTEESHIIVLFLFKQISASFVVVPNAAQMNQRTINGTINGTQI